METVSHREMRNNSGEILRRVEAGETIRVTNNGHVAAVLSPPTASVIDDLINTGQARAALRSAASLKEIARSHSSISTGKMLEDLKGER